MRLGGAARRRDGRGRRTMNAHDGNPTGGNTDDDFRVLCLAVQTFALRFYGEVAASVSITLSGRAEPAISFPLPAGLVGEMMRRNLPPIASILAPTSAPSPPPPPPPPPPSSPRHANLRPEHSPNFGAVYW